MNNANLMYRHHNFYDNRYKCNYLNGNALYDS